MIMNPATSHKEREVHTETPAEAAEQPVAWAEIERGRFQPRRIRGSYLGRELG
jgi:hypothetical protein